MSAAADSGKRDRDQQARGASSGGEPKPRDPSALPPAPHSPEESEEKQRRRIKALVRDYCTDHKQKRAPFRPGETAVPYGGRVFDADEMESLVDAALDFWLTAGPLAERFEARCAAWQGVGHALLVNSGSSALLLAVMALADRSLGNRRLAPGDEVITAAMGFPTTVAPIVMAGAVPVFVDVTLPFYNPTVEAVRSAITPRTRAIVLAHALGNPFDARGLRDLAEERGIWLIEDNCDALGSRLGGRLTGTFGHLATLSFFASHHMTMGEGGAVITDDGELAEIVRSLRDWGRDCVCPPGRENTCGERFVRQDGSLPFGYDHKYVYARLGFNLKITDLQAAVGLAQIEKLDRFVAARRANYRRLAKALARLSDEVILPRATPGSEPSWFGFPITLRAGVGVSRRQVVTALEERKIATRMLLAGNLARQPAFEGVRYRVAGSLDCTDRIMKHAFWVGVYPGITAEMCDYLARSIVEVVRAAGGADAQ